jgi:hypothetical protein
MRITLREYSGILELPGAVSFVYIGDTITFGRGRDCTYQIAANLPEKWRASIGRLQATVKNGILYDGDGETPSLNGVWVERPELERRRIGPEGVKLVPGLVIRLGPLIAHRVELSVTLDPNKIRSDGDETYSGDKILELIQAELVKVQDSLAALGVTVGDLVQRVVKREQVDVEHTAQLSSYAKRLHRFGAVICGMVAVILFLGLFYTGSDKIRDQLLGGVTAAIVAGVAAWLEKRAKSL